MFQQLTGINAIMFYVTPLFSSLGFGTNASLYATVITGAVNVLATIVSIVTVDRFGRKFLFLIGGCQMFLCQVNAHALATIHAQFIPWLMKGFLTKLRAACRSSWQLCWPSTLGMVMARYLMVLPLSLLLSSAHMWRHSHGHGVHWDGLCHQKSSH